MRADTPQVCASEDRDDRRVATAGVKRATRHAEVADDDPHVRLPTERRGDEPACVAAQGKWAGEGVSCDSLPCTGYCPGDVAGDGDGDVTLTDFAALGNNFGLASGATRAEGDFNCDGTVSLADFAALGNSFGCVSTAPGD